MTTPSAPSVALRYAAARVASGVYFHGTSEEAARKIMQQGFSLRGVGQRQRAVHGDDTLDPQGVFVTSDLMQARWYAGPDPKRPGLNRGGAVVEVKVSGRMMSESDWWKSKRRISEEMGITGLYDPRRGEVVLRAQEEAKKQGYAGFHEHGDEYVVFDPKNVKPVRAFHAGSGEPLSKTAARPLRLDRSAVNRLLDDLYKQVERSSRGRSRRELGYGWLAESKFTVTTPKGDRREVIVELNTVAMKPSFRDVVVKGGYGYIKGTDDLKVSLTLNGSLTPDQFLNRRRTEKEIRAAMMHELTHASEVKGTLADLKGGSAYDYLNDPDGYHNDPREVRAWMRQVYEEIREDPRAGVVPIEVLLKNNRWWKQAEPHLTRKSRNRILKGLVTAFEDDGIEVRPTRKTAARCSPRGHSHSWIRPNGKVELLGGRNHDVWAIGHVQDDPNEKARYEEWAAQNMTRRPWMSNPIKPAPYEYLLRQGWVRVANYLNFNIGKRPGKKALRSAAEIIVQCADDFDFDPQALVTVDVDTPESNKVFRYTVEELVTKWGDRRLQDSMFEALLEKTASRTASRPEYGYHATFLHNLDGIASSGLRPSGGSQFGGGYSGHSRGRVFLSDWGGASFWMSKMEDIANHNSDFKTEDDFGWTPISLRVDIGGLEGELSEDELGRRDSGQSAAWYVEETIDPDFIEVWNGSRWVPVRSADPDTMMDQSRDAATYESDEDEEYDEWGEPTGWWEVDFDVFMPGRG
jgi:hypothetical protein